MKLLTCLDLSRETVIKVLAVSVIGPGDDIKKDDPLGYWPCNITWTDRSTDEHIANLDETLTKKDTVTIISFSKNAIMEGFYTVTKTPDRGIVLEEF